MAKVGRKSNEERMIAKSVSDGVGEHEIQPDDVRVKLQEGPKPRMKGNWIKATPEEVAKYEAEGLLKGYQASTGEVLLKEDK